MSNQVVTEVWICDSSLNRITRITNPYPLAGGMIVRYSKELDEYGQCTFRVSAYDTTLKTYGDILVPHKNWIKIIRNGAVIWQGAIIENTKRTSQFIECVAAEPLWYLNKILINRSSIDPSNGKADNIYRIFNSGTMAAAVTAIMNETITTLSNSGHALATMTLGTVTNPNYPPNITDANNPPRALTGPWSFGNGVNAPQLTFDFHTVLYVLKSFGVYTFADFYLDPSLVFNFVPFKGNNLTQSVTFNWNGPKSPSSNIIDYNLPRLGQRMANDLWGIATDPTGLVLNYQGTDQTSIGTYGDIAAVAAYSDIKDQATLFARIGAEMPLISQPDNAAMTFTLNEKGYPLGFFDVGDIVSINIQNNAVSFQDMRRVVGYTVTVHNTGREFTSVQTNKVQPWQFASLGSPQ